MKKTNQKDDNKSKIYYGAAKLCTGKSESEIRKQATNKPAKIKVMPDGTIAREEAEYDNK